ncbi:toll/interleukin-1 receptor domain-containing protein, partial [Mycobacterium sp.]|uniref:toll/interleukin-1 receptor domain-containing protein n=1 Tax=Mycobacterium sp. TaxID=1785 RepID=UPI002D94976A|nr:toll/interleukin-1 receptor domain-containing protein [Mycobacterium sp.]
MPKPLIFISHRHVDSAIASKVAGLLREWTGNQARIYLSSDPDFEGPEPGAKLNEQLKRILAESDVVLLIYTSSTEDWSYCMWECGIAIDPSDQKKTDVIVLQCAADGPKPFGDRLRVNLFDLTSIRRFVTTLLTSSELFSTGSALTGFTDQSPELLQFSNRMLSELEPLITGIGAGPDERATSPFVRLEIDATDLITLRRAVKDNDVDSANQVVLDGARVVSHRPEGLFGFELDGSISLGAIGARHLGGGGVPPRWLLSLVGQIRTAAVGDYPVGEWAPFRVEGDACTIPVVTRIICYPSGASQFEAPFMPVLSRPIPVAERMVPLDSMFHKNLGDASILLTELRAEMKKDNRSRVPVLDGQRPRYIVHGSLIADYLTDVATTGADIRAVTLRDLMDDPSQSEVLAESFAVVEQNATMGDAT